MNCDRSKCKHRVDFEEMPNGSAKGSDGKMYRRFKETGPNYSHLTPVGHDTTTSSGMYKCSYYPIDINNPNKAIR